MPARQKRTLWILLGLAVLILLALPKLLPLFHGGKSATASGAGSGSQGGGPGRFKVQVTAHIVQPARLEARVLGTGTLRAGDAIQLKSETAGRIVQLPFKEGSHVPKGKLLVKINDAELRAQLIKARAALGLARATEERQRQLVGRGFISRQEYDEARQSVLSAQGDMELLRAQIAKTEIRAPFDGVVGLASVSVGNIIAQGTPIANFVSDAPLKVDFSVPEQYFDSVSPGKRVAFTVQGGDRIHNAKVFAVDPLVDEATRTVNVRAICDSVDPSLAPGAFARLTLVIREKPDALALPSQALVPGDTVQQVYVLQGGKAVPRKVRIGLRTEADVEILEGIKAGDTVITTGLTLIRPGAQVDLKSVDNADAAKTGRAPAPERVSQAEDSLR
ncbi:MAG: MexH family multidrug efflux transporter periplasmic adaptor subunit [Fibrobacteres bacterium]|nr:MexH family multidrug efflux transporter periplasmic adaptor subunit [Fibrobacterota bacterium]